MVKGILIVERSVGVYCVVMVELFCLDKGGKAGSNAEIMEGMNPIIQHDLVDGWLSGMTVDELVCKGR